MNRHRISFEAREEREFIAEEEISVDTRVASLQFLVVELLETNERLRQTIASHWPNEIAS